MLAIVNTPGEIDPVQMREVDQPEPSPNETVVSVRAFSINRGELLLISRRPAGWRPGQDFAGMVLRTPADGSGPAVGTRVVGLADQGAWAEQVSLPPSRLAPLADNVTFEQAATLGIAGLTALRLIRRAGSLIGKRVLITGAAGGVGRFLVELAYGAGAQVTAVVGHPERAKGLAEAGAAHIVTDIRTATGPFETIFEAAGGDQLAAAVELVAPLGLILLYGNSSREQTLLDFVTLLRGHPGAKLDTLLYATGDPDDLDLGILAELVSTGRLHPYLGFSGNWKALPEALTALRERQVLGKVALSVGA